MYKNRISHVQNKLSLLASYQADDFSELRGLVEPIVESGDYESIYMASAYIMRFLQLLNSDKSLANTEISRLASDMMNLVSYINVSCASKEDQSFVFTKGRDKETWELSQKADEIVKSVRNCSSPDDLSAEVKKAEEFKNHLEFIMHNNGLNDDEFNAITSMTRIILQSIQDKVKEFSNQPKKNKSLFRSRLHF